MRTMVDRWRDDAAAEAAFEVWADAMATDSAELDRMEGLPSAASRDATLADVRRALAEAPAHHLLKHDGQVVGIILADCDPSDHAVATSRAHKVLADLGSLKGAAWLARQGTKLALLDRDEFADCLVFVGHTPIAVEAVEIGFGCRLPS